MLFGDDDGDGGFDFGCLGAALTTTAQETPAEYQEVLKTLDRKGDFKSGVLKVNIPRSDLRMTIQALRRRHHLDLAAGWR